MRTVYQMAFVDIDRCNGCGICSNVCPVLAIRVERIEGQKKAFVSEQGCQACTICATRCPKHAVQMIQRSIPLEIGGGIQQKLTEKVVEICRLAHMYPDQVVCYCHRVQAKEIVAAILEGAKSPEEVAQKTGARTGCGVLCITGVIRLLRGAGIQLGKAPGYQWYGVRASIWDISPEVMSKYPEYYLQEDKEAIEKIFPGGEPE
ncbi:(2Fe-2S)-binding protein [Desulfosporosinus sp. PR]|uniref:(2Fe-2S)-binding protein n=1 Tax=Candidatus Desulfosporosinus nitrosoreducens TaxID=3401928 RepID=UPI0027F4965A|nr:(2Fe-2S)-binding protein [Desulfosporosinus sp. PR]MDQ7095424.1 (2Fe-2S)-binding protein [Desulfosporosinus sp. PR]